MYAKSYTFNFLPVLLLVRHTFVYICRIIRVEFYLWRASAFFLVSNTHISIRTLHMNSLLKTLSYFYHRSFKNIRHYYDVVGGGVDDFETKYSFIL